MHYHTFSTNLSSNLFLLTINIDWTKDVEHFSMAFLLQQDDLSISQHYDLNMQEKHLSSLYQHKPTDVEEIYFHLLTPPQ